jgi:hypothetical protein
MCRNLTMHVHKIYCDLTNPHGHAFLNTWLTIPGIGRRGADDAGIPPDLAAWI